MNGHGRKPAQCKSLSYPCKLLVAIVSIWSNGPSISPFWHPQLIGTDNCIQSRRIMCMHERWPK